MSKPTKQIHFAAGVAGVNNSTVWSNPAAGSQIEFSTFRQVAQVVPLLQERGVFRAEYSGPTLRDHLGLRPRKQES